MRKKKKKETREKPEDFMLSKARIESALCFISHGPIFWQNPWQALYLTPKV
jgi:hypothetical protein